MRKSAGTLEEMVLGVNLKDVYLLAIIATAKVSDEDFWHTLHS